MYASRPVVNMGDERAESPHMDYGQDILDGKIKGVGKKVSLFADPDHCRKEEERGDHNQ
jgi:hypothetical protein